MRIFGPFFSSMFSLWLTNHEKFPTVKFIGLICNWLVIMSHSRYICLWLAHEKFEARRYAEFR